MRSEFRPKEWLIRPQQRLSNEITLTLSFGFGTTDTLDVPDNIVVCWKEGVVGPIPSFEPLTDFSTIVDTNGGGGGGGSGIQRDAVVPSTFPNASAGGGGGGGGGRITGRHSSS